MHRLVTRRVAIAALTLIPLAAMMLPAQGASAHVVASTTNAAALKVGLVLDTGGRNDKSFNQLAYQGALDAQLAGDGSGIDAFDADDVVVLEVLF